MPGTNEFSGKITVASRIVDQLSSGLYESPAACLKELVNNAYDADATIVDVFVKPDADRIIIEDDGIGMNRAEFVRHFGRISESYKRDDSEETNNGRKKIGKIGIGFIAANEICDTMEIFSTKKGSTDLLHVSVHFERMRSDPSTRRQKGGDYEKGDYTGEVLKAKRGEHYTQIILKQIRPTSRQLFASEHNKSRKENVRTLYGKGVDSIYAELADPRLSSWSEFDEYSQNMLRVALNVPVKYFAGWVGENCRKNVRPFEEAVSRLDFTLKYDGSELRKPIVLRPAEGKKCLVIPFSFEGDYVSAFGYFYAQHGGIRPHDLQGLLLRVRNAAIGGYDTDFLDFPPSEGSLIQRWISAEIWGDDRLEVAMNIDRKTLRVTEPAYVELQSAIHSQVRKVIATSRERLYKEGNEDRARAKATNAIAKVSRLTDVHSGIDRNTSRQILTTWHRVATTESSSQKSLLRRYDVAELYEIVLDVAKEFMDPKELNDFVRRLTARLAK